MYKVDVIHKIIWYNIAPNCIMQLGAIMYQTILLPFVIFIFWCADTSENAVCVEEGGSVVCDGGECNDTRDGIRWQGSVADVTVAIPGVQTTSYV